MGIRTIKWRWLAMSASALLGITGALLTLEKRAEVEESNLLRLPCYWPGNAANNAHLMPCDAVLQNSWLDRTTMTYREDGPGVPSVVESVTRQLRNYAGYSGAPDNEPGLYGGSEPDPLCKAASKSIKTVCDLGFQNGDGVNKPELTQNWVGQQCGQTARILVETGGVKVNITAPYFEREGAYLTGARIQALKCHAAAVLTELQKTGNTSISLLDPVARQMAQDFNKQVLDKYKSTYLQLGLKLNEAIPLTCNWNNGDIKKQLGISDENKVVNADEQSRGANSLGGHTANPAIHICALRALIVSSFARVIAYEIFARMQTSYVSGMLSPENQQKWADRISKDIGEKCKTQCAAPTSQCAQDCYDKEIAPALQTEFNKKWPLPTIDPQAKKIFGFNVTGGAPAWPTVAAQGATCQ